MAKVTIEMIIISCALLSCWTEMICSERRIRRRTGKIESCFTTRIPAIALTVSVKNKNIETMNIENAIFGSCIIRTFLRRIRATVEEKMIVAKRISPAVMPVESGLS